MRSVMDTMRSLHLEVGTGASSDLDSRRSWLAESSTDGPAGESCANRGPDAAAGRSLRGRCDMQLPIEASQGSNVASVGAVQLERSLGNIAALHGQAMRAIDRIARQHAALRRFPMVCPSCSAINSPTSGQAWGAGDIVVCKGCGRSYIPVGQLQDSDLTILRTAVQQMRDQSCRVQYLEQVVARSRSTQGGVPAVPCRPESSETGHLESRARPDAQSDGLHLRQLQVAVRSPPLAPSLAASPPLGERSLEQGQDVAPRHRRSSSPPAFSHEAQQRGVRLEALHARPSTERETVSHPRLLSLVDTQDLLTSSSVASASPCIFGAMLNPRQPNFDTLQSVKQDMSAALKALGARRRPREREDGELTSEAPSEGEITSCSDASISASPSSSSRLGSRPAKMTSAGEPAHKAARRLAGLPVATAAKGIGSGIATSEVFVSPRPDESQQVLFSAAERRAVLRLAQLLATVFAVRFVLVRAASAVACAAGHAVVTTLLAVTLAGGALVVLKLALRSLNQSNLMDTSTQPHYCCGEVSVRVGSPGRGILAIALTVEEALSIVCALAQLTVLLLSEVWGLHGPRPHRWLAVPCHAGAAGALVAAACRHLAHHFAPSPLGGEDAPVLWLCVAACNWATASWAMVTWWPRAAAAAAENNGAEWGGWLLGRTLPAHAHMAAAVGIHALSLWIGHRMHRPMLLFASVILGGISMAWSCHMNSNPPVLGLGPVPWVSVIFPLFCAMSAWTLWQDLVRSL